MSSILRISLLFALGVFCVIQSMAQTLGSTPMTYMSKSGKVVVKLSVSTSGCSPYVHWLNAHRDDKECIAGIQVFRDGVEAYIPDFSYNFLAAPRNVELREVMNGYTLKLAGGDASSSYVALFTFEKNVLRKRRIASAEFPEEAWEDTTFRFNLSNR